jgi:hypothetical protein
MSKLGQEPAYPVNEEQTDRIDAGVKIYSGMSKRIKIATDCISVADNYLDNCSVDYISKIVGIDPLEYKGLIHYPQAIVKMAYAISDELLRQEAL